MADRVFMVWRLVQLVLTLLAERKVAKTLSA